MGHTFNIILFLVTWSMPQAYARYLGTKLEVASSIDASRTWHEIAFRKHCQQQHTLPTDYCAESSVHIVHRAHFLRNTLPIKYDVNNRILCQQRDFFANNRTCDCSSFTYLPVDWSGHFMRTSGDRNPGVPALGADWLLLQSMICQVQIFRKGYYIGLYTVSKLWGSIQCGNKMEVWKKLFKGKG